MKFLLEIEDSLDMDDRTKKDIKDKVSIFYLIFILLSKIIIKL